MAKGMVLETCSMEMVISTEEPGEMVNIMVKENIDGKQRNQSIKHFILLKLVVKTIWMIK